MNPNDVVRLLNRILPWIPTTCEGIRGEIQQVIDKLKGK